MSKGNWFYYCPDHPFEPPHVEEPKGDLIFQVGGTQLTLMLRARRSKGGMLILPHGRSHNRERLAARRLAARGLLLEPNYFGSPSLGYIYAYTLTNLGRGCWLKVWSRDVRA